MYRKSALECSFGVHTESQSGSGGTFRNCMYRKSALESTFGVHTEAQSPSGGTFRNCMYRKSALESTFGVHTGVRAMLSEQNCRSRTAGAARLIENQAPFNLLYSGVIFLVEQVRYLRLFLTAQMIDGNPFVIREDLFVNDFA